MKKAGKDVIIVGARLVCACRIGDRWSTLRAPIGTLGDRLRIVRLALNVRRELTGWFGPAVADWHHLKTYRIRHALPAQPPPISDPAIGPVTAKPGIYICGAYGSVPGIQWALLSGRRAAEAVLKGK